MLISTAEAREQVRWPVAVENTDLDSKLADAEAIVLAFIARPTDAAWTATIASWGTGSPAVATPGPVRQAILMQLAYLWTHRGDDDGGPAADIAPAAARLLRATGYRDYVLA